MTTLKPCAINLSSATLARLYLLAMALAVVAILGMPALHAFHATLNDADHGVLSERRPGASAAEGGAEGEAIVADAAPTGATFADSPGDSPADHSPHDAAHCATCVAYSSFGSDGPALADVILLPFDRPLPYVRPTSDLPPVIAVALTPAAPRGPPARIA